MDDVALAQILAPIEGDSAIGGDVRSAGPGFELYLSIKDERSIARSAEREALALGDPEIDPLGAGLRSWREVARQGDELLVRHSKDLQVAAWLTEALLRIDGLTGLAAGCGMLEGLVARYWDDGLYPAEDEEGVEARLAPLFGLFGREEPGTLIQPIKLLPLADHGERRVALWSIEAIRAQAVRHDDPEVREELIAGRDQRIAQLEAGVASASPAFIAANLDAIDRTLASIDRLMSLLDERTPYGRFGSQVAAPLAGIAEVLGRHRTLLPSGVGDGEEAEAVSEDAEAALDRPADTRARRNPIDRQTAIATLLDIASFFDRAEPQSLMGHGLRDLVRRANLPLDDLLAELLPDREQRAMFLLRAGVRPDVGAGAENVTSY